MAQCRSRSRSPSPRRPSAARRGPRGRTPHRAHTSARRRGGGAARASRGHARPERTAHARRHAGGSDLPAGARPATMRRMAVVADAALDEREREVLDRLVAALVDEYGADLDAVWLMAHARVASGPCTAPTRTPHDETSL